MSIFNRLSNYGQAFAGLGVGVVIGASATMPLGWHLPDQIAGLVGAFAGAIATVGGGLWLWQAQDQKTVVQTISAVESACAPLIAALTDLDERLRDVQYNDAILSWIDAASSRIETFRNRALRYEGNLFRLPSDTWRAYSELEDRLDLLVEEADQFRKKLSGCLTVEQQVRVHMRWAEAGSMRVAIRNMGVQFRMLAPNSMTGYPEHGDEGRVAAG